MPYRSNELSNSEQLTVAMPQGCMTGHTCTPPSSCAHPEGRERDGEKDGRLEQDDG